MKKVVYIFLLFSSLLFCQNIDISKKDFYFLKGNIGSTPISMYLYIDNNNLSGKYYYDTIKQIIDIKGSINGNTFRLNESINDRVIGSLEGEISDDMIFTGNWISADKNNTFNFSFSLDNNYPINKIRIINAKLDIKDDNGSFESSRDAVVIENDKNIKAINRISLDIDDTKSIDEEKVIDTLNNLISSQYNTWKETIEENDKFNMQRSIEVSFIDENIISFSIYNYSYAGGVHGIYNVQPNIYLISTGKRIGLSVSELIDDVADIDLINLMRSKLTKTMSESDFFDFESITLSDTFDITPTGIKFIWPAYKISDYAHGIIEIEFRYSELKPFVKQDSVFMYLFE
ncbi:PdaC/SigV domain-containing protein [Brachyspira sp. SAP_772]|uniref:PdaC/SigV domain-containing protein n=1 Tax=Brachyspira sp. SAP_772 TaxID=2608385 RepID=UPI0012F47E2B|nr:DUF4163 domain-containing protein [Brachyspira sp. SAP_772]